MLSVVRKHPRFLLSTSLVPPFCFTLRSFPSHVNTVFHQKRYLNVRNGTKFFTQFTPPLLRTRSGCHQFSSIPLTPKLTHRFVSPKRCTSTSSMTTSLEDGKQHRQKTEEEDEQVYLTQTFRVTRRECGTRIDKLIAERFNERSRTYIQKLLANECVKVNDHYMTSKSTRLNEGQLITVSFLPQQKDLPIEPENIPLELLYEDEDIIVVNKPMNMVVHPSPGHWTGTLVHALCYKYPLFLQHNNIQDQRPGIVHRLDKDTTGAIVIARHSRAHASLTSKFSQREVQKEYIAITVGNPCGMNRTMGHIEAPIGRCRFDRIRMAVDMEHGKHANTTVHSLASDSRGLLHAVRVELHTGRTHQIRVHLQHVHAPILGDDLYGKMDINKKFQTAVKRPMLHAHKLQFEHPMQHGQIINIEAPLPDDMMHLMRRVVYPECDRLEPSWSTSLSP